MEKRNDKAFKNCDTQRVLSLPIGLWVVELSSPIRISVQKAVQMYFLFFCNSQHFGTLSDCSGAAQKVVFKIHKAAACTDRQICDKYKVLVRVDIS